MRTVITTREYDDAGKLTRETEVVYDSRLAPPSERWAGSLIDTKVCTCGKPYSSIVPMLCPVHTYTTNTSPGITWTSNHIESVTQMTPSSIDGLEGWYAEMDGDSA